MRAIAADLGRAPSTISRGVARHRSPEGRYVAKRAHAIAFEDARRPQEAKLDANRVLRHRVLRDLGKKYSPEEIAGRLRHEFPDDPPMNLHQETIYRWVYLQGRGELKRQVSAALRSGRAMRRPNKHGRRTGQGQIPDMVSIHDRPPVDHPDGTRIPGHWEGDLIIGKNNGSAIGTVVERATGYLMLLHLPGDRTAETVAAALTTRLRELPDHLRRTLTWDQGKEMSLHAKVSVDADIKVYFADPHTPWHRPSNENTNGLLRQYFPKGTDLSVHSAEHLRFVEQEMNDRPRKRLDYLKPQELMTQLLLGV
jgi:IS30 family transposase